ncbi:unnamed protein product [Schistosoma guineensis]|nr:unnamed protein product [Schistosoma guineensis]
MLESKKPINKEYLCFSDKEIYCCLKTIYQSFSAVELRNWIHESCAFIFKCREIHFSDLVIFLCRLKTVTNDSFINNSLLPDEAKRHYLRVFIKNIDHVVLFRTLEHFLSEYGFDGKFEGFILCFFRKQRELLLNMFDSSIDSDLITIDSINLLKLFDNFAPNSQSDILSAQLLWMNFFTSRWLSYNPMHLLDLKFRISVTASKVLHYNGYSDASEALARKSLVDFAEMHQLRDREKSLMSTTSSNLFHVVAIELSSMVFKRSVFESRKRPQGYLRPKVRVEFATLLQHSWPRTITERYLNQLIPNSSAQILAILEALSLKPGERRSLIIPKPPVDSSDWEMSDVYTELFIASMELIYPNSSKKLIPNFLSGIHVIRKIPVDREKTSTGLINHTIALNETKFLKWTQLDLIHYQYNYHDSTEEYDENGELSSESKAIPSSTINTNVSCTIDSLMKLIQIYFACAQYDIFDLVSRDTLHVFEEKLLDLIKEQVPKEFIQYIQAQIDTLELLRVLHSAQLSIKVLNKNEIIEDVLQQPIVQETPAANAIDFLDSDKEVNSTRLLHNQTLILNFLPKGILKLIQKLDNIVKKIDELQISMYDNAILIDIIIVLWDYCHILCHKWFIQNKLKIEYFNTIQMKLIGILYLFSLMKTLLESLNIDVADGLMSCNLIFYVIWITEMFEQKLFHHNSRKESSQNFLLDSMNIKLLLKALTLQMKPDDVCGATECNENDKLAICLIDLWTGIWNKVMDIIYWSRNMISKRMIFLQINHPKNLEINSLSELQVELLWFEHTIRWKLRNLEWLTWCDLNEMSKEKVHKKIEQMDENSLKQCGRNKMSKVFYYCLKAETEVNNETAKKYYKIAEKLLFNKWSNEFHSIGSKEVIDCQQSTGLSKPHENTLATERFRSDRPPPPIVIAKCENSMVFQTQKWNPLSGEQVHFYALYGKQTFVSNQKVHITDNKLTNTGILVICNDSSSVLKVTDLTPNEEYAFAVAAYNKEGHPIGSHKHGLGHSTKPVLAYSSLCIYTGLCHLLQSAFRRNLSQCLMAQSVNIIWEYLTEKYDTKDDDNSTHLTGLKLKDLNSFQCSSILLKHLTTCILWHCSVIQKSGNLRSCKFDNSTYLLDKQIQKIHLSEKLVIGLELSAMLNDVQLLLDFANLIYETLSFNIEMSSVTHDYAKILLKSLTIILGVRKCTTKLILLDETLNRKLTQIMIKFTFELIKVFEVLNELKGIVTILKIVKVTLNQLMKDIKPSINVSTKKRISQGKLSSSYLTGRRKSRQNTDQMGELNSVIKTIDAYSYLVTAKLNPPRGELFGYEDEYQAIACMATKPIKAAIKDVIKFNRRTIFLQLVNVILERVHVSQINLIQPCLNEIRTWLNHRDQLLVKSCQSYETTDIMKLNDNMNATSLDKTKSTGYSQEMNHLFSLLTDYYSHKMRRMKLRNVCQDEWTQRSQFNLLQAQIEQNELLEKWQPIIVQTEVLVKMEQLEWFTYYKDNIIIDYDQSLTESLLDKQSKMNLRKSINHIDNKKLDRLVFSIPQGSTRAAYKASQAIFNYLGSFVQEHLYDTNSYEKNDKNQCPVMENEDEINEDFIDTQSVLKLPDNIEKIFDFIKRSTNLGYRAKCWPKVYNAAKFCWNATSLLSSLLCKLSIWCNEAKIRRETDVKLEANIKITNKNSRKGINTDGEKNSIQTQARNSSLSEIMNYLKQCTNRRALANIAWSCWFMSTDNILDLFESSLDHDEITETKSRYDNDWLNEQSGKIWRSEIMNNQFDIDWNWLHCFILKALEIICRASKWEYLTYLGLKAVGTLGKHWAPGILPFIIFGQNQIMKRLKKQKTTNTTINDMNNIEQLNADFGKLVNRSQIQLYSALYHYNFIQPKSEEAFTLENHNFFNNLKSDTFGISLKSNQFLELINQCKTFKQGTFPWTKDTVTDTIQKPNIIWINFSQQESEGVKPVQPKVRMSGWLIPQSHLKDDQLISNTKSLSEEEIALCNIFLPLNSKIIEDELKEAECLHYSGIMNKMDQARLYQSLVIYLLHSLSTKEINETQLNTNYDCSYVMKLVDLQNDVSPWERKVLFVINSKEGLERKTYENLIHHTIKFYNEALELLTPYNNTLQEMIIHFELLRFYLIVDQIKRAKHQALLIMDILFEQKNTLDNFDRMLNNCDLENVMKRYSFRIIQRYGISGCLLGALVMGLLCKYSLISNDQVYKSQMICATLFKSMLHGSLSCARKDIDYYGNSISTESLRILKLDEIFTNYCFDLNNVVDVLNNTLNYLITHEQFTEAFPVIYLFYYIGKNLLKNIQLEFKAKLFQIQCLIGIGALKQSLFELCAILQEQSSINDTHDCHISLINFDDIKMQECLNILLTNKLSKQTIHKWGSILFCEIQLVRAEICYEIAKSIPYLPKKMIIENQISSTNPNRNQVTKSSGRKVKNQVEKNIVRLLYEMENQNSVYHSNFQSYLKQLLFNYGSDVCQLMINSICNENHPSLDQSVLMVVVEAAILLAKLLTSQHQARSGSMLMAYILKYIQNKLMLMNDFKNCKTSNHSANMTQKQVTQQDVLSLWFRCRAELVRCQIYEVDGGRILQELPETENYETPEENDNLKIALEETKTIKFKEYWNEFTLLNNQLLFIRNRLGYEKTTNIMIEEISLTNKCNQLLVCDILRESDLVVQESFQNILTVNDDSLLIKLEDRLKILLNVQKILIQELNNCGEGIRNTSLFQNTIAEVRLPLHKNWKNLIQIGLRVSLILLSLGDIKSTHSLIPQANKMRDNYPDCIRILTLLHMSSGQIYDEALGVLIFSQNILKHLPPNCPCIESELLFIKGHIELRLFLENKVDWQSPSQSWLRSICISAFVTGDKLFQHRTEIMLVYFWQLVYVQRKCQHLATTHVQNIMDNKLKTSLSKKELEAISTNEIEGIDDSFGRFSQSVGLCIWNILLMIDQFLSQRRQCSSSTTLKSTGFLHPNELNNRNKSIISKISKSESPKRTNSALDKAFQDDSSVMHQFDLVGKKCLDSIRIILPGDDEYELINLIQPSNQFDGLFDYVKNRTLVSEYWNVVFNSTSMVSDENQLLINRKYEWKKLKKIKLNMDILKLYESVLYENVLNIKQLFERNKQNIKGPNVSNCQESQNEDCITKVSMQNVIIPISAVPYYSQDAEYWFQRFTSLQVHLYELNGSVETETFGNLSNIIKTSFSWFNDHTPENENFIQSYISPYNMNFEPKSPIKIKNETRRGGSSLSKYLLMQTINNFENDSNFYKCLPILISCYSPKAKLEAHLYQQRLVLFDNSDEFFKMIDQFNKIVIKYSAANIFSDRDKANINIKSTTLKSSSVNTNDKSLDSENFNHSDLEFQDEFNLWLDKFDKILRTGKIVHNPDQDKNGSTKFTFMVPNLSIQINQPIDEIFNSLKEIISWRYFGGSLIKGKFSEYITKLYRMI